MPKKISVDLIRSYGIGSSIIAIIQSVLWVVLCFIGILYYLEIIKPHQLSEEYLGYYLYEIFLNPNSDLNMFYVQSADFLNSDLSTVYVKSADFLIINIFYFFLSLIWFGISVYFCIVSFKNQWDKSKYCIIPWTIITTIVIISDIVLIGILGYDFNTVVGNNDIYVNIVYSIVIFVTARGFVLFIINLIYVILFSIIIINDYRNKPGIEPTTKRDFNPIQAYNKENFEDNISIPNTNTNFTNTSEVTAFSTDFLAKLEYSYNMPKLPRMPYAKQDKLIPTTPPADYTPPSTPFPFPKRQGIYKSYSAYEPLKS